MCVCVCFVKVLLPTLGQKSASQVTPLRAGHDTNRHSMSPSGTPATQSDAAPRATIADPSARPDPAQRCERHPATQNKGRCHLAPRLPRKVTRRPGRLRRTRHQTQPSDVTNWHACHAKRQSMSPSATPLPRKVKRRAGRPTRTQARHQTQCDKVVRVCERFVCVTKFCAAKLCER